MTWLTYHPDHQQAYEIAHAAAIDAGNRSMKQGLRIQWNEEDWQAAWLCFDRLCPDKKEPVP